MAVVAALLALGGAWAAMLGAGLVVRAVRQADDPASSLWIIRGLRGLVVAVGVWALTGGWVFEQTWLLVFGAVFLAEELYETGVVVLLLSHMGGPDMAPHTPQRSGRPGEAVAPLDTPTASQDRRGRERALNAGGG